MSQQNVEAVLRMYPAPNVDFSALVRDDTRWAAADSALLSQLHPAFEVVANGVPSLGGEVGPASLRPALLDWLKPWASYRVEIERAVDCGDRVLVIFSSFGRIAGSTEELKISPGEVWTFRDGRIARWEIFPDRAEALKAVGFEE